MTAVRLLLAWTAITAVGFALNVDSAPARSVGVQSLLYLAIAWWLGRRPEVVRLLAATPSATRVGLLVVLAALVTAQLAGRTTLTFPFVRWDMYSTRSANDPWYVDLTGVGADGRERPLDVVRTFPALNRNVTTGLRALVVRMDAASDATEAGRLATTYDATIRALAARWSAKHPDAALRAVRVWRVTIPTAPFRGADSVIREPLREVPLP